MWDESFLNKQRLLPQDTNLHPYTRCPMIILRKIILTISFWVMGLTRIQIYDWRTWDEINSHKKRKCL
jgi:hypothetical protein